MNLMKALTSLLPAIALTACATTGQEAYERPQVRAVQEAARMDLLVDAEANGLVWDQLGAFQVFVDHYKSNGHGPFVISVPQGGGESEAAHSALTELRAFLDRNGVSARFTEEGPYAANGVANPPLIVSYLHYVAEVPERCRGTHWDNLAIDINNQPHSQFGCAMAINQAAMIGDPYHLHGPTDYDAPDSARRQTVLDTYRRGEPTSTQRRDDESGAVSTAVD